MSIGRLGLGCAVALIVMVVARADIPVMINHQGIVKVNGLPFTGNGQFKFGFMDAAGNWLWTNDGSHVVPPESANLVAPNSAITLPCNNGIYNVRLGDGMAQILTGVFDDDVVQLRVYFNDGTTGFQVLSPDQPVTSTAYAYHASVADNAMLLEGLTAAEIGIPSGNAIIGLTAPPPPGYSDSGVTLGGAWSTRANMTSARAYLATVGVNGSVYAIGGNNQNEAYHVATNTWSTKANMPTSRNVLGAAEVNGTIYAIGGHNGSIIIPTNEAYDTVGNTWTTKAPMPTTRQQMAVVAVGGIIYAIGGVNGGALATNEAYSPATNTWTTKAPMPTARQAVAAAAVNGIIYVIGGSGAASLALNEAYDPVSNTWSTKAPMPTGRYDHTAAAAAGLVYVIGGQTGGNNALNVVQAFNPGTNTWSTVATMPTSRFALAAAVTDGRDICVVGGFPQGGGSPLNTNHLHSPHLFVYFRD